MDFVARFNPDQFTNDEAINVVEKAVGKAGFVLQSTRVTVERTDSKAICVDFRISKQSVDESGFSVKSRLNKQVIGIDAWDTLDYDSLFV